MAKINKNYISSFLAIIVIIATCFVLFAIPQTRQESFATSNSIVNNVVLFTFKDLNNAANGNSEGTRNAFINRFDEFFNSGYYSPKSYYSTMSDGRFSVNSTLVRDADGNPIYVELSRNFSDFNDSTDYEYLFVDEIIEALKESGVSFSYDEDNYIDCFTFVYMDFEYTTRLNGKTNENEIVSHNNSAKPHIVKYETPKTFTSSGETYNYDKYIVCSTENFLINTQFENKNLEIKSEYIKLIGQAIGLPELTPANVTNNFNNVYVGEWDLMGKNYLQSINAYFKYKLGWLDDTQFVKLTDIGTYNFENVKAYYIEDPSYPNQKIVFEYRDLEDSANSYDYNLKNCTNLSSGLTIYRINENYNEANQILASNRMDQVSVYYFRQTEINGSSIDPVNMDRASFRIGAHFGINESDTSVTELQDINTYYISFETSSGSGIYKNSNLVIEVETDTGVFNISGGKLDKGGDYSGSLLGPYLNDENLLKAFANALNDFNITPNNITLEQVQNFLTENGGVLDLSNSDISNLTGLATIKKYLPIYTLILNGNRITAGMNELAEFTYLENLQMFNCGLTSINFIAELTDLRIVNFSFNRIRDFSPLTPELKTKLEFANIALNDLDTSLEANKFILDNEYADTFVVGYQGIPKDEIAFGEQIIYFDSINLPPSVEIDLLNGTSSYIAEDGTNSLDDGKYSLYYHFNDSTYGEECEIGYNFEVVNVTVKNPLVEILVGEYYGTDSPIDSLNNWVNNSTEYRCDRIIIYKDSVDEENIQNYISTDEANTYIIQFNLQIKGTNIELYKTLKIYRNNKIEFIETPAGDASDYFGIIDRKLYIELLSKVGKNVSLNYEIGVDESNSLYEQDLYFFDIVDDSVEPITELDFANKGITNLWGLHLLNLQKIKTMNFNQNKISDIKELVYPTNPSLGQTNYYTNVTALENLHLADNGIEEIDGNIKYFINLKVLDLSFNKIERADALKPLADYDTIMGYDGIGTQKLEYVNLNMNNIKFNSESAIDFNYFNSFLLKHYANLPEGYKSNDEIFILLIQGLENYSSYINKVQFHYYPSKANEYQKNNKTEYRFKVQLDTTNHPKNAEWDEAYNKNMSATTGRLENFLHSVITTAKAYTLSFSVSNSPFKLGVGTSLYKRTFYLSTASIKSLRDINQSTYTLEDLWDIKNNKYSILSTEMISLPSISDLSRTPALASINFECTPMVEYQFEGNKTRIELKLENYSSYEDYRAYFENKLIADSKTNITIYFTYSLFASGTQNKIELVPYLEQLTYQVEVKWNEHVTIEDENLKNKLYSVLKKEVGSTLYIYDTYNLTKLDLSNAGIRRIENANPLLQTYDFSTFKFNHLTTLNLSKNNLTSIQYLSSISSWPLQYLDVSYNSLSDSSELNKLKTLGGSKDKPLYVNAFMNLYIPSDKSEDTGNNWLITGEKANPNIVVFAGIQGINATNKEFITYAKEVTSATNASAGFYFFNYNLDLILNKTAEQTLFKGTTKDTIEEDETHYHNYYHYYTEVGTYNLNYTFSFGELDFKYQGTIKHSKAYPQDTNEYIIKFDSENSQETIEKALNADFFIYENCSSKDFKIDGSRLKEFKSESEVEEIRIDDLNTYIQQYNITHIASGEPYPTPYQKIIRIVDDEAPTIEMLGDAIYTTIIGTGYNYYRQGDIDRDIIAKDNYDSVKDIDITLMVKITGTIINEETGEESEVELSGKSIPINRVGTYTLTFWAVDSNGNKSEELVRKVKVEYNPYETLRITKPSALAYAGEATFQITVYRNDATRDLNPTFNWYIDGKFVAQTQKDADLSKPDVVIKSTVTLDVNTAGRHSIEVRINENEDPDFTEENTELLNDSNVITFDYFVLLDKKELSKVAIIVGVAVVLIVIIAVIVHTRRKNRKEMYSQYDYNIISKR